MKLDFKRWILGIAATAVIAFGLSQAPATASTLSSAVYTGPAGSGSSFDFDGTFEAHRQFPNKQDWSNPYSDQIAFTLSDTSDLLLTADTVGTIVLNLTLYNASNLVTSLYAFADVSNFSQLLTNLAAGDYILKLSGNACHCGSYQVSIAATATTPLPASMVMFLTALGGLGLVGYVRGRSVGSAA